MDLVVKVDRDREERLRLGGTKAGRAGREPHTYREGRVCAAVDCSTILSRYNPRTRCWQHEPARVYLGSRGGRRPAEIHITDLTSLRSA
jgi:hypothetical protein